MVLHDSVAVGSISGAALLGEDQLAIPTAHTIRAVLS
jgi:hypothetical protein